MIFNISPLIHSLRQFPGPHPMHYEDPSSKVDEDKGGFSILKKKTSLEFPGTHIVLNH